jgi:hypothetical protein
VDDVKSWMTSDEGTSAPGYGEDFPAFAASILRQLPPSHVGSAIRTESAKSDAIDRAVRTYRRIATTKGEAQAFEEFSLMAAHLQDEMPLKPTSDQTALAPLVWAQRSDVDFLSPGMSPLWDSKIETISIVGTDTARVVYAAVPSVPADPREANPLAFRDPTQRYSQILRFERVSDRRWRLVGWPNYLEAKKSLESNVEPPSLVRDFLWWNATAPIYR